MLRVEFVSAFVALAWAAGATTAGAAESPRPVMGEAARALLERHCFKCHSADRTEAGVRLDTLPRELSAVEVAERWQQVLDVLNSGSMPPEEEPQPEPQAKIDVLAELANALVVARTTLGDQGQVATLRRLNRREYRITLEDLLGIEVDVRSLPDDKGTGTFDTVGASLFMSSDQFEQYLTAGRSAMATVLAAWGRSSEPSPPVKSERREVEIDARNHVAGLCHGWFMGAYKKANQWKAAGKDPARVKEFGFKDLAEADFRGSNFTNQGPYLTSFLSAPGGDRGAWLMTEWYGAEKIVIPADAPPGDYVLRLRVAASDKVPASRRFLEMRLPEGENDSRSVGVFQVNASLREPEVIEVPVKITPGGPRKFVFCEKKDSTGKAQALLYNRARAANGVGPDFALWIDWVEWEGPLPPGAGAADRWRSLFGRAEPPTEQSGDSWEILKHFATRACRGVVPPADYLEGLVALHAAERADGKSFLDALVEPMAVILASPGFLYLNEPVAPAATAGADDRQLSDLELASRLSYFLWAGPPDDVLLAAASGGGLRRPEVVAEQTARMIADPKSLRFARGFTHQWLTLDRLDFFQFDMERFPDFDDATRNAAREEVYHTFHRLLVDNADARKLLKNDSAVVNDLLAAYYGIQDITDPNRPQPITGPEFRPVALPAGSPRGGLLGMAAILAMGSNGSETSPVERGAWVLRKLVNDPPPPAPANVPQLSRFEGPRLDTRSRLRMHQEEPQCATCHREIDPLGLAMENFNAAGQWRTEEFVYGKSRLVATEAHVYETAIVGSYPIAPAGAFHEGPAFADFFEFRDLVAERGDDFLRGLIENMYAYALGRPASFTDRPTIDALVAAAKADGAGVAGIVQGIVKTTQFQTK